MNNIVRDKKGQFMKGYCLTGTDHPSWKGGRTIDARGYVLLKSRNHPYAKANGYVCEHRLVMEAKLGRYLLPNEVVHHRNKNKQDNRIENLQLFSSHGEHIEVEGKLGVYKGTHKNQIRDQEGRFI